MITRQEYLHIRAKRDAYTHWVDTSPLVRRSKNGAVSYPVQAVPATCRVSHDELSAVEVYDFFVNPPQHYTAYVCRDLSGVTTWTGEFLGQIVAHGKKWRSNFGDTRQRLTVRGLNGRMYSAIYHASAGDYCHMTAMKKG